MNLRSKRRSLPRTMAYAVAKAVAFSVAGLVTYVGLSVHSDLSELADGRTVQEDARSDLEFVDPAGELITQHDCSTSGLGDEIPASALVRRGADVELVTFDEGWAVHLGEAPGILVAVCREPVVPTLP